MRFNWQNPEENEPQPLVQEEQNKRGGFLNIKYVLLVS